MFLWSGIIYGPVHSRRLGKSLGVNLLPTTRKVCTYDCPYCECGYTHNGMQGSGSQNLPSTAEVLNALEQTLQVQAIDAITLAGNGEPTLHPHFAEVARGIAQLATQYAPNAKKVLLTNGIRLKNIEFAQQILPLFDEIEVKLDAGTEESFARIAQPTIPWTLADVDALLCRLGGQVVVQSCIFSGEISNTSAADRAGMLDILQRAQPKRVELYTISRRPANAALTATPSDYLQALAQDIRALGIPVDTY